MYSISKWIVIKCRIMKTLRFPHSYWENTAMSVISYVGKLWQGHTQNCTQKDICQAWPKLDPIFDAFDESGLSSWYFHETTNLTGAIYRHQDRFRNKTGVRCILPVSVYDDSANGRQMTTIDKCHKEKACNKPSTRSWYYDYFRSQYEWSW